VLPFTLQIDHMTRVVDQPDKMLYINEQPDWRLERSPNEGDGSFFRQVNFPTGHFSESSFLRTSYISNCVPLLISTVSETGPIRV
jgi:hypothetical protein